MVRHGEGCFGRSRSATAAAARRAVRSAPKAKCISADAFHSDTLPTSGLLINCVFIGFWTVGGLQFGRALQIEHRRQPRHWLHQELRSVPASFSTSPGVRLLRLNACTYHPTEGNSTSETCAEFRVRYVGAIEKLQFSVSKTLQEPLELITYIDAAQVKNERNNLQSYLYKYHIFNGASPTVNSFPLGINTVSICDFFLLCSKMGSFPSCQRTRRWFWVCPSMESKLLHWISVWVKKNETCFVNPIQSIKYDQKCLWRWCCQDILHRHPLYLIVRMLCYDDGLGAGKNLLALKTTDSKQEECSIWVYQCISSVRTAGNHWLDLHWSRGWMLICQ